MRPLPLPAYLTRRSLAGFTLIELLIVIIIIGILVAIGVPAYLQYQAKANDRDAQAALQTAFKAAVAGDSEVNNSKFPVATTVVNDVKADEPAASITRGDCAGNVIQAPVKQVQVDPSSTSSQLTMCVRSASGTVWRLTGPLTGTPTMADGSTVALTWDANEITDAVRAEGVSTPQVDHSYDGLTNDSSTGVWSATTNLVTNGGFETGKLGWSTAQSSGSAPTINQVTTGGKFGSGALDFIVSSGTNGGAARYNYTYAINTTYTASFWYKAVQVGTGGSPIILGVYNSGPTSTTSTPLSTTVDGVWRRASVTFTTDSSTQTGSYFDLRINGTASGTYEYLIDGAQLETKLVATPYVETNGGAQFRAEAHLKAPSSLLTAAQGWVAMRIRPEWSATSPPSGFPFMFDWRIPNDGNNRISGWYSQGSSAFGLDYIVGNTHNTPAKSPVQSFTPGTNITVIYAWDTSYLYASAGGSPFGKQAKTVPTLTGLGSLFDFGSDSGPGLQCDCEILWAATGTGSLSDTDAATINGWGDTDPKRSSFPASAQATMAWDGTSSSGSLK